MKHIWRILQFTGELKRYYVAVGIFTIVLAAMGQLQPLLTKGAVDQATKLVEGGEANVALVGIFAGLIFLTDVGQTIFANISGYVGDLLSIKLKKLLSSRYYEHLMNLPQTYFDKELTGTIINRMNRGIQDIGDWVQMFSNNFLQFIFSTIFTLIIVAYYSWPVALMLGVLYPVFVWMTAKTSGKWQAYQKQINDNLDVASGRFAESVLQVKVVKSFIQEARELKFFNKHMNQALKTTKPQSVFWHRQDVVRRTVLALIFLGVFMYIFIQTARGVHTIGEMVLLIQYSMLIRIPIFSISFLVDRTQRAVANSKDYFEVMDTKLRITDAAYATDLRVSRGKIVFDNVSFAYDHTPVLNGINLTIKPDTKVALVGESGEGKTTITNLLMRLYEPQSGTILIDGQDISKVTQQSLRRAIGVVFQDPALFSGTIQENISYANPNASDEDIEAAARAANAHEFIEKLENGYQTQIGERGLKLSGGQKQRIAIARALLKNAPILILDEATSSLDSKSEALVQEALERLMSKRTTLIIAHRLSTIQNVDQIITLSGGKVDEIGSPNELANSGGIYEQLLRLQNRTDDKTKQSLKKYGLSS